MKWKYIFLSARFKPLILGIGPIFMGLCLSFQLNDFSRSNTFFWFLNGSVFLSVVFIQIATHFFNSALDFIKGVDTPTRKGPKSLVQKGQLAPSDLFKAGFLCLFLSTLSGLYLVYEGGWPVFLIGVLSLILAYCYTGGPYPLSYTGLADFFVLLFFGLIPTSFVFYLNTGAFSEASFVAGLNCGLLALSLLVVNNLRDKEEDSRAGKKTLVVRFGKKFGMGEWGLSHYLPYLLGAYWFFKGFVWASGLPFLLLPFSIHIHRLFRKIFSSQFRLNDKPDEKDLYKKLFINTLLYYSLFVFLWCVGIMIK